MIQTPLLLLLLLWLLRVLLLLSSLLPPQGSALQWKVSATETVQPCALPQQQGEEALPEAAAVSAAEAAQPRPPRPSGRMFCGRSSNGSGSSIVWFPVCIELLLECMYTSPSRDRGEGDEKSVPGDSKWQGIKERHKPQSCLFAA